MRRTACIVMFLVNIGIVVTTAGETSGEENAKLVAFFKSYLDKLFLQRPLEATRLGDHRFDHLLDDFSPESRASWTALSRSYLQRLPAQINYSKLPRSSQIDFEIFQHHLKRALWLSENTRPFEQDPRIYNDVITDGIYLLLTQSTLPRATNIKHCVSRMAQIPRLLTSAKKTLLDPPRVFVETAIRQNRGAIAFFENGLFELAGETPQLSELGPAARPVVASLKEYQHFLEKDLLPRANGDWRLGREKFARKLELELDAGLSAEQVLDEAEKEFVRVERDMYVMARQLWGRMFSRKALPPDDPDGRRSTIQQVLAALNSEHGQVHNLTHDARSIVAKIKAFITMNGILRLPEPDHCQIIEMPEFQRGNSMAYLNPAPPLDPRASSFYGISPPPKDWDAHRVTSFMEEYNSFMLQILTIHEAFPGHYVQLEYSNRNPSLIRRVLSSGVFAEGWAVYTEQMMLDQGYGNGDMALRLNQLKWYLRSVANAILDHKMHCNGMSDEEAFTLLGGRAFQTEGEVLPKIVRSKQSSCQLSTYFVGRMAFYKVRQEVEREQGATFNLSQYHEAVLSHGTLPVKYLPELVRTGSKKPS